MVFAFLLRPAEIAEALAKFLTAVVGASDALPGHGLVAGCQRIGTNHKGFQSLPGVWQLFRIV